VTDDRCSTRLVGRLARTALAGLLLWSWIGVGFLSFAVTQAETGTVPPAIAMALESITRDADYVAQYVPWSHGIDPRRVREFSLALSAMNFVQQRVSSLQYGYRLHATPDDVPATVEACLVTNAGICGNQVAVYIDLARRLGLPVRSVEFYWTTAQGQPVSHVGVEVKLGGQWRYFDVTWGAYFIESDRAGGDAPFYDKLLSFEGIQHVPANKRRRITNESALVYQLQLQQRLDPFEYLAADKSVLYGKTGTILLLAERTGAGLRFRPTNRPNYIGVVQDYSSAALGETSLALRVSSQAESLDLSLSGVVCTEGRLLVQSDHHRIEVSLPVRGGKSVNVPLNGVSGILSLAVVSARPGEPCYLVYDHIDVQAPSPATLVKPHSQP